MVAGPDQDKTDISVSQESSPIESNIINDVILGHVDPRTLTREEYEANPELLFHGAKREFTYLPEGVDSDSDAGADYGIGFYTTNDEQQANNYSHVRQGDAGGENSHIRPVVYKLLPYQARMLDVRNRFNTDENGQLPRAFIQQWVNYLGESRASQKYLPVEFRGNHLLESCFLDIIQRAESRARASLTNNLPFTIRRLGNNQGIFNHHANGLIDGFFADFMKGLGYDGLIYREGGEGLKARPLTGYVFYNLSKLNTWEGWQGSNEILPKDIVL